MYFQLTRPKRAAMTMSTSGRSAAPLDDIGVGEQAVGALARRRDRFEPVASRVVAVEAGSHPAHRCTSG